MFDIETLRFILAVLSLLVLLLFYAGVYRPTRSAFAGWWSLALLAAAVSPLLLLFNGTEIQVVANPLSNCITAVGTTFIWFATRSLRGLSPLPWIAYTAPAVVLVASLLENPSTNRWAGNSALFAVLGILFTLAARDMWIAWRTRRASANWQDDGEARVALMVSALASTTLAVFYVWRTIVYVIAGHESWIFETTVGSGPTAVTLTVTLVAVTFSAAALGFDQQTQVLRRRVAFDDLTGLLARAAFFERVTVATAEPRELGTERVFVVADLDHFKAINDEHGHAAGDRALELFSTLVDSTLREGEFAGRLGGEEFALLLYSAADDDVLTRLRALADEFAIRGKRDGVTVPTVSFGVAPAPSRVPVEQSLARADAAMYKAKAAGRDRIVVVTELDGLRVHDG